MAHRRDHLCQRRSPLNQEFSLLWLNICGTQYTCCGPMRSVPHRGSGWVLLAISQSSKSLSVGPTRYRDVVLTSWGRGKCDCGVRPTRYDPLAATWNSKSTVGIPIRQLAVPKRGRAGIHYRHKSGISACPLPNLFDSTTCAFTSLSPVDVIFALASTECCRICRICRMCLDIVGKIIDTFILLRVRAD